VKELSEECKCIENRKQNDILWLVSKGGYPGDLEVPGIRDQKEKEKRK